MAERVLLIDADHRRRKMLVNFAHKFGVESIDVADFAELERSDVDCPEVAVIFVYWDGAHTLTAVADALRRQCPDATLYLMSSPPDLVGQADAELPGGVLLLSAPVSWTEFQIAMLNGRRLWKRTQARRSRRRRLDIALGEVAQRLVAGVDIQSDPDLEPLWSLVQASVRRELNVDGFAVLERQRGASFWRVATASGVARDHLSGRFRDPELLPQVMAAGEAREYMAGKEPHTPWLREIQGDYHLAMVPQTLAMGALEWVWLALRKPARPRFHHWDLDLMHEIAQPTSLVAGEAVALNLLALRMAAYLNLAKASAGAEHAREVVEHWARAVFAATEADGGMVRLPGNRQPVEMARPDYSPLMPPALDALAEGLEPGHVDLIDMRLVEGGRALGGWGLLAPFETHSGDRAWFFAHFKREPGRFNAMLISKALPQLLSALKAYQERKAAAPASAPA